MRTDILAKIDACISERNRLERDILVVNARIQAYEDVLNMLQPVAHERPVTQSVSLHDSTPRGRRALSGQWKAALSALKTSGFSVFSIDNLLESVAATSGVQLPRGNVRSQMAAYVTRGVIERVGQGHFRLTPSGEAQLAAAQEETDECALVLDTDGAQQHEIESGGNSNPTVATSGVAQSEPKL